MTSKIEKIFQLTELQINGGIQMKSKIELVLQFMVFSSFGGKERLFVGIYRMRENRRWVYNIATHEDGELLREDFDNLESFRSVQKDKNWMRSWEEVTEGLVNFNWTAGIPEFCHHKYVRRIWEAYEYRQDCFVDNWCLALGLHD